MVRLLGIAAAMVLVGCRVGVWFGLVGGFGVHVGIWPGFARCNVKTGSGSPPYQLLVADVDGSLCHQGSA